MFTVQFNTKNIETILVRRIKKVTTLYGCHLTPKSYQFNNDFYFSYNRILNLMKSNLIKLNKNLLHDYMAAGPQIYLLFIRYYI